MSFHVAACGTKRRRGDALLGDEASLTFHRQGVDGTSQQIAMLRRLTLDNPARQKSPNELAEMIPRNFAHLDRFGEAHRTGGVAALKGHSLHDPKQPTEVLRTIHSFDPCIACAVRLSEGEVFEARIIYACL